MPTAKEPDANAEQDASYDGKVKAGYSQEVGGTGADEDSLD